MMTLSARSLENALADRAHTYLVHAHRLPETIATPLARTAAQRVLDDLGTGTKAAQHGPSVVIRVARELAQSHPDHRAKSGARPVMPAPDGRPMREQPLDPVTLADLSDGSRRSGRRLMNRLPSLLSVALGLLAVRAATQAVSSDPSV